MYVLEANQLRDNSKMIPFYEVASQNATDFVVGQTVGQHQGPQSNHEAD